MTTFNDERAFEIAFRAAHPLERSVPPVPDIATTTVTLPAGSVHAPGAYPLPIDIRFDQDVPITVSHGHVLYADIFRPTSDEQVPVILAYTPYSKRGGWWNDTYNVVKFGAPAGEVSGLQAFEAPDPGFWVPAGYAIAYVDAAGTSRSGGDEVFMGTSSGRNAYDMIEWLAAQPWSSGKIAMAGNSQLGMIQWATAALKPPHLAAIAPWEGLIDTYREVTVRGGIPDPKFHDDDIAAFIYGLGRTEDLTGANLAAHPLFDEYWADKRAQLDQITIPAYIVASWTSPLHPHGTLQAFREIESPDKWLRVHNDQEWLDGADPRNVADLRRFFDRYLKGIENGWETTPRVRLSILDPGGEDEVGRTEQEWPLARAQWRVLHLDATDSSLSAEAPAAQAIAEYDGTDLAASARFSLSSDEELEITGHLNLHLWVEAEATDMDLFAAVYKESRDGRRLHHITLRGPQARGYVQSLERDGLLPATLSYTGPVGRLRVSHRALDPELSTPSEPVLTHKDEQQLTPGEIVPVELSLWPTSFRLHVGERLVVEIAGHPTGPLEANGLPGGWLEIPTRNEGRHRIHTGGPYDSHLLLPVIPRP